MYKSLKGFKLSQRPSFTLVELMVIIAVVAILVGITIVGYGSWKRSSITTQMKNDLSNAAAAMQNEANFSEDGYPTSLPSSLEISDGIELELVIAEPTDYCIQASSLQDASLHYYIDKDHAGDGPQEGTCPLRYVQIAAGAGSDHTCAIASNGQAYCWGDNTSGRLGRSTVEYVFSSTPIAVDTSGVLSGLTIKAMSAGDYHTCAIASDNQAYCWGSGGSGKLGNGSTGNSSVPVAVDTSGVLSDKTIESISANGNHTCVIASDNQAYCWGYNTNGQLGDSTTTSRTVPVAVDTSNGLTIKSISAGVYHTCAIASDNKAYCWGQGSYGRLGNGLDDNSNTPVAVSTSGALSGLTVKSISSGYQHTCVVASDDNIYCWGDGYFGQLGRNSSSDSSVPVSVDMSGALSGLTVKSISSGYQHTCVVASDDNIYCWGRNSYGQIGVSDLNSRVMVPTAVDDSGLLNNKIIESISAGSNHTCAITTDGQAYCWGTNQYYALGVPDVNYYLPQPITDTGVLSGKSIQSISTGDNHSCVIALDNQAYCWGYGNGGKLGNGSSANTYTPVAVDTSGVLSGLSIESISCGGSTSCAVASNDQAYCWGSPSGDGTSSSRYIPVAVDTSGALSGLTIKSISTGNYHVCVVASDSQAYCWGDNSRGQLGDGTTTNSYYPLAVDTSGVLSGLTIKSVIAGDDHTCVVASDNQAYCWGEGSYGQLGDDLATDSSIPVAVDKFGVLSGLTIKSISTEGYHTCAIASDDQAYCWGQRDGLGTGSMANSYVPVKVNTSGILSGKSIVDTSGGAFFECSLDSNGAIYCWGQNTYGQLGINSTNHNYTPIAVDSSGALSGKIIKEISAGSYHICAIDYNGQAYCWGYNSSHELGYPAYYTSPVRVAPLP